MVNDRDTTTLTEVIMEGIKSNNLNLHVSLPAKIIKIDKNEQSADIQLLIKKQYVLNDENVDWSVIPRVPIHIPSSNDGNSFVSLPLKANDLGFVIVFDRSIDNWLSGDGSSTIPDDPRNHDFSDCVFVPGLRTFSKPLSGISSDSIILKNNNSEIEILKNGKFKITDGTEELLSIINDLMTELISATTVTMLGASPFTATTITKLQAVQTKLASLKA